MSWVCPNLTASGKRGQSQQPHWPGCESRVGGGWGESQGVPVGRGGTKAYRRGGGTSLIPGGAPPPGCSL